MIRATTTLLLTAAVLGACGPTADSETEAATDSATAMPGMPMDGGGGMEGMDMADQDGMMASMRAHMERMDGMMGDSMLAILPEHRQMVANMIAQMNREMRDMGMAMDDAWTATVDSLREDLVQMPEMGADGLEVLMPEHRRRALRLMEMHREMMAGMGSR